MTTTPTPDLPDLGPLPEPFDWCYEWDGPYGTRKFSAAQHNGMRPHRSVPLYTPDQMHAWGQRTYALGHAAGVAAAHEALSLIAAPQRSDGTWNRDREACRQIAADALAGAGVAAGVPAGWKLVPVEATRSMCAAAVIDVNGPAVYKNVAAVALEIEETIYGEAYKAMLAASPTPPAEPAEPVRAFNGEQVRRLWDNSPDIQPDAPSFAAFKRIVRLVESAHSMDAAPPQAAQPPQPVQARDDGMPLTDEQIMDCFDSAVLDYVDVSDAEMIDFARAIERVVLEKSRG